MTRMGAAYGELPGPVRSVFEHSCGPVSTGSRFGLLSSLRALVIDGRPPMRLQDRGAHVRRRRARLELGLGAGTSESIAAGGSGERAGAASLAASLTSHCASSTPSAPRKRTV